MELSYSNNPKVSVIIPCYNREDYIRETIDSVLNQTYPNIELICVDDGCTDGTRKILDSYESKITVFEHPGRENKGQSASINLGIQSSESDYVAVLDSDDLFASEKIEKQVKHLNDNPDIGYMYSNGYAIDKNGKNLFKIFPDKYIAPGDPETVLLKCPLGTPSGYLVRRLMYVQAGYFDEKLRSSQDHDMAVRLAETGQLGYLDETLWYKREHCDSLSGLQSERRWRCGFIILKKACKRYPYSFSVQRQRRAILHFRLGQCMIDKNKFLTAAINFVSAGLLDPKRAFGVLTGKEKIAGAD